jgi:hypothetical protein
VKPTLSFHFKKKKKKKEIHFLQRLKGLNTTENKATAMV